MIYFTSDLHFGHKNVLRMGNRPFADIEEMNAALITNWNRRVSDLDEVYILGDISLAKNWKVVYEFLRPLHGKKYLIKGNHEHYLRDRKFLQHYFELITDYHELRYNEKHFILSHYPFWEWNGKYRGSIHLYGHVHAGDSFFLQEYFGKCYCVGVESNAYTPVSIEEIIERMEKVPKTGLLDEFFQEHKVKVWNQAGKTEEREETTE